MPGWESYKDLLKLAGETAFSAGGNAFFDLGSFGASAVADPLLWLQGFGNKEAATEFAKRNAERRANLPELDVSPRTEELQEGFLSPVKEGAEFVWEGYNEAAPEGAAALEQYFTDPRVLHTLQTSLFATPAFMRGGAALKSRPSMITGSKAMGTAGTQRGIIDLSGKPQPKVPDVKAKEFKAGTTQKATAEFAAAQNAARSKMSAQDRAQVDPFNPQDFDGTVYMTPDGTAGFSLTKDGYLGHVFRNPDSDRGGVMTAAMTRARGEGAKNLDAFDTYLVKGYKKRGAVETERNEWNPQYATPEIIAALGREKPDFVGLDIGGVFPEYKFSQHLGPATQAPLSRYTITPAGKPVKTPDTIPGILTPENLYRQRELMQQGMLIGGDRWYHTGGIIDAFLDANPETGFDVYRDFTGFGSGLSPRSKVDQEIRRASFLNYANKRGIDVTNLEGSDFPSGYGHFAWKTAQRPLIRHYLKHGVPGDPKNPIKAPSYFWNRMGNFEPYTIDGHDFYLLTGEKRSPNAREYPHIENAQSQIARELGLDPAEGQSAKWFAGAEEAGIADPRNLTAAMNMRVAKTASDLDMSEDEVLRKLATRDIILRAFIGGMGSAAGGGAAYESMNTGSMF
jgi:hypothetical protein